MLYLKLFWNNILATIEENYLLLCICVMLDFKNDNPENSPPGINISSTFSIMTGAVVVVYPFFCLFFYCFYHKQVDVPVFQLRYGAVIEGMNLRRVGQPCIVFKVSSQARRFLLAYTVVYADQVSFF